MPLEISEDIVSLAYQSLGYFVVEGLRVGHREIDILAVRVGASGSVEERLHIEVQISTRPVGAWRDKPGLESGRDPTEAAKRMVEKKFADERVVKAVETALGSKEYDRVFVYGETTKEMKQQLKVLEDLGIKCMSIANLVKRARRGPIHNRLQRAVEIAELLQQSGSET